jgi:hypothetical protein
MREMDWEEILGWTRMYTFGSGGNKRRTSMQKNSRVMQDVKGMAMGIMK